MTTDERRLTTSFVPDGNIDGRGFRKALRLCRGQMSAVLVSRLDTGTVTVLKGNKPLSLRYSRKHRAVLYALEPEYIEAALDDLRGWRELEIPPLTMLILRHENLEIGLNRQRTFYFRLSFGVFIGLINVECCICSPL